MTTEKSALTAVMSDVTLFRDALIAINELVSEGNFRAKARRHIPCRATDPTMVALVDFKFLASGV